MSTLRMSFARLCRDTRVMLDITQGTLAASVGLSRASIASIESGRANPSLDVVERIGGALGLRLRILGDTPIALNAPRQRDVVHARCSGYVDRRIHRLTWPTFREVTIGSGRLRGWIDLLAYDPVRRLLVVVEIKTWIDDLGAAERQLGWYVREAPMVARDLGLQPAHTVGWLLCLATADMESALHRNREAIERRFPARARDMRRLLAGDGGRLADGIALIDPRSHRRDWLIPSRLDGRRSGSPYLDLADAARAMSA